jgi:hypothetical protein
MTPSQSNKRAYSYELLPSILAQRGDDDDEDDDVYDRLKDELVGIAR